MPKEPYNVYNRFMSWVWESPFHASPVARVGTPIDLVLRRPARPHDPFGGEPLRATFHLGDQSHVVTGFVDAEDGSLVRFRTLPLAPGTLEAFAQMEGESLTAEIEVAPHRHRGVLQAKGDFFAWSISGEPFFWNSTTAYLMLGLREEVMNAALDRLAEEGVNRIRVAICPSRQTSGERWMEPTVTEREDFTFCYGPWPAARPEDPLDPGFDTTRFDLAHWRKLERLIARADEHGMVVHLPFLMDAQEDQNYPFDRDRIDDPLEIRYFDYAVGRLAGFPNVEWCVTNEWALYRPDEWVEARGKQIAAHDPFHHLVSVHGHAHFPFAASSWCTHLLFQVWDEHGIGTWASEWRAKLQAQGIEKPIVNEEFGYEDHYPYPWGESRVAPARNAESRARILWSLFFAGAWGTTGESSASGRGGWINGHEEGPREIWALHRHLRDFAGAFDWAASSPDSLASGHAQVRAKQGEAYAIWLEYGGQSSVSLPDEGPWDVDQFDPYTGEWKELARNKPLIRDPYSGPGFVTPFAPYGPMIAFLIHRS